MKKITKSFFAISISTSIIFQSMAVIGNGEEIETIESLKDNSSNYTYVDNMNLNSEDIGEKDVFPDPFENNINRPGNETSNYLRSQTLTASKPFAYPKINILGKVTANSLNVRELPSTSKESKVLSQLNKGSIVQILSKENDWYKISYFYRQQVSNSKYDVVFKEAYVSEKYIDTLSVKEKGIDVSYHNGNIDWNKVKASGVDYAIIRAGYGTNTVDTKFKTNIEGAIKAGLKIGIYWFSYASSPEKAKIEAQKCLEVIKPYKDNISYPVFFDFEQTSEAWVKKTYNIEVTQELGTSMAKTFMDTVKSQGYTPGLYTGIPLQKYFSDELLNSSYTWLAQYSYRTSYPKQFSMWQYCEDGYIDGVSGKVDINYTLGSEVLAPVTPVEPVTPQKENISSVLVDNISDMTYTGSPIKPSVKVSKNGKILKENTDYTVTYSNNTSVGTGKVTITGKGNYTGTKTVTFKIVSRKITDKAVSVDNISDMTYTGKLIKPSVKVRMSGKVLKENTDYTLTYSNNTSLGTGKITIKGKGNYTGTKTVTFKIVPQKPTKVSLSKKTTNSLTLSWSKINNVTGYKIYKYDSKSKSYEFLKTISNKSTTSYTDKNLNSASSYSYKVRGYYKDSSGKLYYGKYSDIFKESTKVNPVKNLKLSSNTDTSLKISWSKVSNAEGYKVYRLNTKTNKYELVKTIKNNSTTFYTDSKRVSAETYYYRVKAYKYLNGSTRHSDYSSTLKATTKPVKPNVSLRSTTSKSIQVSWTNISKKSTGYEIRMSTSKNGTYKSIGTTKNKSYTKRSLTRGKTYYFKVRAYRIVDGKKIYSSYSSVKSIKCK